MADIFLGGATVVVCCVLVMVLAIQMQIRSLSHKIDQILEKVGG